MGATFSGIDCEGTKEELIDLCLMRLYNEHTNQLHAAALLKVVSAITGTAAARSYPELLSKRLKTGCFRNESEWIASCARSKLTELEREALSACADSKDPVLHEAACAVVVDPSVRGDLRAQAIDAALKVKDRTALLALCDVVGDCNPALKAEFIALLRDDYPFRNRPQVKALRTLLQEQVPHWPNATKTIGDLARAQLKKLSKKDFGADTARWREWVLKTTQDVAAL